MVKKTFFPPLQMFSAALALCLGCVHSEEDSDAPPDLHNPRNWIERILFYVVLNPSEFFSYFAMVKLDAVSLMFFADVFIGYDPSDVPCWLLRVDYSQRPRQAGRGNHELQTTHQNLPRCSQQRKKKKRKSDFKKSLTDTTIRQVVKKRARNPVSD